MPVKMRISLLLVVAVFWLSGSAQSQTFMTLKSFSDVADGAYPEDGLVLANGVLYGATTVWAADGGSIFRINIDGTGFRTLYTFDPTGDSAYPNGLLLVGNTLYGTTYGWSANAQSPTYGTIFRIDPDGNNFTNLYTFNTNNQGGINPAAALVFDGTNLFGTTAYGGTGYGTVFKIDTNGGGYSNLHVFTNGPDGASPNGGLLLSQGVLYGTADGLYHSGGVVFKVNTDGSAFTVVHDFSSGTDGGVPEGKLGVPEGRLIISGNTLYGAGEISSYYFCGIVFRVNTDGSGFAILHSFPGAYPAGLTSELTLLGHTLYGETLGSDDFSPYGTVFKMNADGSGFATLYTFTNQVNGADPWGGLVPSGGLLYGITTYGGSGYRGTVFALNPATPLKSTVLNGNLVLSWDDASFQLQSAPTATGPFCNIPGATSPYTNAAFSGQQFFRLQNQ